MLLVLTLFQILTKYVNGLLNTKGGVLVFGVRPNTGTVKWHSSNPLTN